MIKIQELTVNSLGACGDMTYTTKYIVDAPEGLDLTTEQLVMLCDRKTLYTKEMAKAVADAGGYFGGRFDKFKTATGERYAVYVYID